MKHLILYDGDCPFCNRVVRTILKHDRKKKFVFAPLQGETAKEYPIEQNTLVLIENFKKKPKMYVRAQASFHIARHLGGKFAPLGLFSFLPRHRFFDAIYKLVAKNRHKILMEKVYVDPNDYEGRFLP